MTINQQLQFSVLCAPVASLDRRTLSQAWYSALYGSRRSAAHAGSTRNTAGAMMYDVPARQRAASTNVPLARSAAAGASEPSSRAGTSAASYDGDRRTARSPLARKIERAFLQPKCAARKASFTLEGEHGRVHVLLQSSGARLKLVAICPPNARAQVAQALAQARYALALRGIDLDAATRERVQC